MTIGEGKGKLLKKFPLPLSKPLPSSSNIFVFIESLPPSFPVYGCEQSRKLRICVTRLENSPSHFLSLACFLL